MNNNDIQDLTDRLSQALDQNYDVVNMETVLSVISDLEGAKITKEQLEATRLAKFINHLRRRTTSENLARRAKTLLKKWREMVGIHQNSNDNTSQIIINSSDTVAAATHCENSFHFTENVKPQVFGSSDMIMSHSYPHDELNYIKSQTVNAANATQNQVTSSKSFKRSRTNNNNEKIGFSKSKSSAGNLELQSSANAVRYQHQPTSFTNLIPGSINNSNILGVRENDFKKSQFNSNSTNSYITETYVIDHSSNSSMECKTPSSKVVNNIPLAVTDPIVIDIQDSDSEQEAIALKYKSNAVTVSSASNCANAIENFPSKTKTKTSSSKQKKSKKDKTKNNHRETYPNPNSLNCVSQLNDTSSNLYHQIIVNDEKSTHSSYPVPANMSEILSLSNSSMSTFFPGENDKSAFSTVNNNLNRDHKMLASTELTFAGKFKKNSITPNAASMPTTTTIPGYDTIDNGISAQNMNCSIYKTDPVEVTSTTNIVNMLHNNSNESSSSHVVNKFGIVDGLSKENNSLKKTVVEDSLKNSKWGNIDSTQPNTLVSPLNIQTQPHETTKIPKKRGRKKGSKGVDSLIGKETSLSSQMLMTSFGNGVKKVKTTKELYAEIQSRNLSTNHNQQTPILTVVSPPTPNKKIDLKPYQLQQDSSCSEVSLLSPRILDKTVSGPTPATVTILRDAADTDSASATSESTDIKKQIIDSNSASDFCVTESCPKEVVPNSVLTSLQKDLNNILKEIATAPSLSSIENSCNASNELCSCKIVEVEPTELKDSNVEDQKNVNPSQNNNNNNDHKSGTTTEDEKIKIIENKDVKITNSPEPISQSYTKPIKSIFDLDFDDEDDPLNIIKAEVEAAATGLKSEDNENYHYMEHVQQNEQENISDEQPTLMCPPHLAQTQNENPESNLINFLPTNSIYKVEEDKNCKAKDYFEIRTQKITQFHIDSLHNCFIPNVNGNWDQTVLTEATIATQNTEDVDNVVPKYGSHETAFIIKDLSHVTFKIERKTRKPLKEYKYKTPFLGVGGWLLENNHSSLQEFTCKDESKENVAKIMDSAMDYDVTEASNDSKVNASTGMLGLHVIEDQTPHSSNQFASLNSCKTTVKEECNNDDKNTAAADESRQNYDTTGVDKNTSNDSNNDVCDLLIPDHMKLLNENEKSNNDSDSSTNSKSSVCSNSSLKLTQQSINSKLRKLQLRQDPKDQVCIKSVNRKRKRKKHSKHYERLSPNDYENNHHNVKRKKSSNNRYSGINGVITTDDDNDGGVGTNSVVLKSEESIVLSDDHDDEALFCDYENNFDVKVDGDVDDDDDNIDDVEDDEDDCDDDDDYVASNDVYHEVVTKASTANGNNHIVLTIKKTPSKQNCSSKPLPTTTVTKIETDKQQKTENWESNEIKKENIVEAPKNDIINGDNCELNSSSNAVQDILKTKNIKTLQNSETKEKVKLKSIQMTTPKLMSPTDYELHKEHCSLFHPEELQIVSANSRETEFIFSCCELSFANKNNKIVEEIVSNSTNNTVTDSEIQNSEFSKIPTLSSTIKNENNEDEKCISPESTDAATTAEIEEPQTSTRLIGNEYENENIDDELPIENNGVLASFNMIYPKAIENDQIEQENADTPDCKISNKNDCIVFDESEIRSQQQIGTPKKNCDECNTYEINVRNYNKQSIYNNSNNELNNIVNSKKNSCKCICKVESDLNCKTAILPYKEYSTGIRAVDEDVHDDAGNNCSKIQQFREWHQVLQLRSYNDELLTVLPYVVLD